MKIIKPIVIILLTMVSSFFLMAILGPSNYKVTKAIKIGAPIDVVFEQTSVFMNWGAWSPWAASDPKAKYTIEQDNQTAGASMAWQGEISGKGIMTSTEVVTNKKFIYELSFIEPFEMTSSGGFKYTMVGDSVLLTWSDEGNIDFLMRPMTMLRSFEDQIAPMFEKGLINIKEVCENMETKVNTEITEEMVESKQILYVSESSSLMPDAIGAKMGAAFGELMALMSIGKIEMASAPISITKKYDLVEMTCEFDAAIPVIEIPEGLELSGRIEKGESYSGKALKIIHTGSFLTLKATYDKMLAYIDANGYQKNGNSWEEYIDDPAAIAEEDRRIFIYFPIQ